MTKVFSIKILPVLGAIAGDVIGSVFEGSDIKTKDFPLFSKDSVFTDDTIMTIAIADAITTDYDYRNSMLKWGKLYPDCGFSDLFYDWLMSDDPQPYNSYGNGSAIRVSPLGCMFDTMEETLLETEITSLLSHNHPEGIKGAQATALAIFLSRIGKSKEEIAQKITSHFGYNLNHAIDAVREQYTFDVSCPGTVPEAIIAFL
jgi:ADP-ribosylglycohydrolase